MPKKVDICPVCEAELRYDEGMRKFRCPRTGCTFVDRRGGTSMVDPVNDRRNNNPSAWDSLHRWEHRR